ncbi:MAG: type II toxin-antitoxin system VapC family toxin [Promicromonosporaceae bacterium]|nr:type II toxin-antitoxin system VapC family toxin [Promicromonosporaceae bacterium]
MSDIYIDTSSAVRIALGDHDGPALQQILEAHRRRGSLVVSSQLLELECRRVAVRLRNENKDPKGVDIYHARCGLLPIDADVWRVAMGLSRTVKTLDAIHLATCSLVPGARLLTSDARMREVAQEMGLALAS